MENFCAYIRGSKRGTQQKREKDPRRYEVFDIKHRLRPNRDVLAGR